MVADNTRTIRSAGVVSLAVMISRILGLVREQSWSHLFHLFHTLRTGRKVSFWYGARSKREMFYDEEFKDIQKKFPNFSYTVALSEPMEEDKWTGHTGFIHQVLHDEYLEKHEDPTELEYYMCGPPPMINACDAMLDSLGVDKEMIAYDSFG